MELKHHINTAVFRGVAFNGYVGMLSKKFDENDRDGIDIYLTGLEATIKQERMRAEALERD
jgi:hypothetical protein